MEERKTVFEKMNYPQFIYGSTSCILESSFLLGGAEVEEEP
jgi:hypothetical protein